MLKGKANSVPSDAQAQEKLALYVYEYLVHMGAPKTAQTFLSEIRWEKNITLGDSPGFLSSWWCVFWDLYCAAPERRDNCEHTGEAKAFHDYGFVGGPPHAGMPNSGPVPMPPGPEFFGPGPSGMPPHGAPMPMEMRAPVPNQMQRAGPMRMAPPGPMGYACRPRPPGWGGPMGPGPAGQMPPSPVPYTSAASPYGGGGGGGGPPPGQLPPPMPPVPQSPQDPSAAAAAGGGADSIYGGGGGGRQMPGSNNAFLPDCSPAGSVNNDMPPQSAAAPTPPHQHQQQAMNGTVNDYLHFPDPNMHLQQQQQGAADNAAIMKMKESMREDSDRVYKSEGPGSDYFG